MLALPIFPGRLQPSIVSRNELNYCVRNGNRWTLTLISTNFMLSGLTGKQTNYKLFIAHCQEEFGDPYRIRTDVKGVRGLCLNHLTNGPFPCLLQLSPAGVPPPAHQPDQLGAPSGTRTRDPLIKSQLLYQLS